MGKNRPRKVPKKSDARKRERKSLVYQEVAAVFSLCAGALTVLSLISYDAADVSFNASGAAPAHNWIGPAGAYWSDFLLQGLGVGAYALGLVLLLAGGRAFAGRRILPGLRESLGTVLLIFSVGALAHLLIAPFGDHSFPAGGVGGAILAGLLTERFATVGAYMIAGTLSFAALTITTDGILRGLGLRGLGTAVGIFARLQAFWVMLRERQRRLKELQRAMLEAGEAGEAGEAAKEEEAVWSIFQVTGHEFKERQQLRLDEARAKGAASAARAAKHKIAKGRRPRAEPSAPEMALTTSIDLAAEERFELGQLPAVDVPVDLPVDLPMAPTAEIASTATAETEVDVSIRAAKPEPKTRAKTMPPPLPSDEVAPVEAEPSPGQPKRVLGRKSLKNKTLEPQIVDVRPEVDTAAIERIAAEKPKTESRDFELPAASLLDFQASVRPPIDSRRLRDNADKLTNTLKEYGIEGNVREIRPGPVVTMYEYVPGPGIKLSKIAGLADDLAMSMAALRVRIVAPIPGKGAVGIEIPNLTRETVYLKEIIAADEFRKSKGKLTLALGKDIEGKAYVADLAKMPHLLVAGATGAGKSVSVNAMIMSLLFNATPADVRLLMVDPKMLELSVYEGIPHLLLPVVTDPKKAALALRWAVEEMERRYQALSEVGVRSIEGYNKKVRAAGDRFVLPATEATEEGKEYEPLPYIVVIVDELADLMMVASREVESSIMRLAQMARASGIHLILATQRPSVDVLTGVIKANFPTRVAFQVASKHDSRTIIDTTGPEHLLGKGDMLFLSPGAGGLVRVHGAYVSDEEIERTVSFLRTQGCPEYDESILAAREEDAAPAQEQQQQDEMYDQAVAIVAETRQASISMIQRRLRIGYNRAARLVEFMEEQGIVGPADGAKPREVLISPAPV